MSAPRVKVCGITRPADARACVGAGATYLGLVFVEGTPRAVDVDTAGRVAAAAPEARWVGVFRGATAGEILSTATAVPFRVAQLHGEDDAETIHRLRTAGLEVWRAVGVDLSADWGAVERRVEELVGRVDAVLLDRRSGERMGGGGVAFAWAALPARVAALLARTTFVLSGGLTPENVGEALAGLRPDVLDVSSGVESAPGAKDARRVRRFVEEGRGAGARAGAST